VPPRKPASPGLLAAQAARRVAVAALYWGPVVFLLATAVLVVGLLKGFNLGPVMYVAVGVLAVLGVASAWSLRRRLDEISGALERAQRTSTVGLLTAGFAHEMKNALTVILGFAELARTSGEKAGTEAKVMRHLREVVRDALSMVRPMARMKELQLEEATGEPPRVVCDPFAVRQLLLNLLLNALDFARTRIQVTTRAADGAAEVLVADDGPGVPTKDRQRIFQRFVTTRPGGNGLGLSTSREIAQAHGGTLALLETESGATFAVRLPAS